MEELRGINEKEILMKINLLFSGYFDWFQDFKDISIMILRLTCMPVTESSLSLIVLKMRTPQSTPLFHPHITTRPRPAEKSPQSYDEFKLMRKLILLRTEEFSTP